jgi:Lipocalin-like domain
LTHWETRRCHLPASRTAGFRGRYGEVSSARGRYRPFRIKISSGAVCETAGLTPTDGGGSVDIGNETVTHYVDVSLFPNWQGHDQVRRVTIEGGRLSIIASDRACGGGQTFRSELIWLRV